MKKDAMKLKKSKGEGVGFMRGFGTKKGRWKWCGHIIISKNKRNILKQYFFKKKMLPCPEQIFFEGIEYTVIM